MCPPCQKTTGTTAFARTPGGNKFDLNFLAHLRSSKENPVFSGLRDAFKCRSWKPTTSAKPHRTPGRRPVKGSTGQSEAGVEGDEPQLEIAVAEEKTHNEGRQSPGRRRPPLGPPRESETGSEERSKHYEHGAKQCDH